MQRTTRAHAMAFEGSRVRGSREGLVGNLHHPRHCLLRFKGIGVVRCCRQAGSGATLKARTRIGLQVKIYTEKLDSDMYRTCHEPMLASMGMQKAILYNTCGI